MFSFLLVRSALAFEAVLVNNIRTVSLEGPVHHGLQIETNGIEDPNLSFYEVQIKPDGSGPFAPWQIYNAEIQPYDSRLINLPYHNGIQNLPSDIVYCVRLRSVYGREVTPWASRCGVTLTVPSVAPGDDDGDGLTNAQELAMGLDPQDRDSDRDGIEDGTEVAAGTNPDHAYYPHLVIRTPTLNFGEGGPFGLRRGQHQFIEIENNGEEQARIREIRVVDDGVIGSAVAFRAGHYPSLVSHVPPRNVLRLPISFLPLRRGFVSARLEVFQEGSDIAETASLTGVGMEIPNCEVSPESLDFGIVRVDDEAVLTKDVVIRNIPTPSPPTETHFGFTIHSTVDGIAPGIRGFVLPQGKEVKIPILFQHPRVGNYEGFLEIRSAVCGVQRVELKGKAE